MLTLIRSLILAAALVVIGGLGLVYSGLYSVAATEPHWPITHWLMETARLRSIKTHAAGIKPPAGYDAPAELAIGVDHFAAHCAVCHGAPGVPRGEIANGLYPLPPDLAVTVRQYTSGELFWILKHGIKMTGMPAWADHSDDELWATVAFLEQLPAMSEADYARLIQANMMHGMPHHMGTAAMPGMAPDAQH
jgi:mono/diheme cytochrome c family protein